MARKTAPLPTVAFMVWLLTAAPVYPQAGGQPLPEPVTPSSASMRDLERYHQVILDMLHDVSRDQKGRDWPALADSLQMLLNFPPTVLLPERGKGADDKALVRWISPQAQARELLAKLPAEARKVYDERYGKAARELLAKARKQAAEGQLVQVIQRYPATEAAAQALALLADRHFEGGRFVLAALAYQRLLRHPRAASPPALTLYRATAAFRIAGEQTGEERTWKALVEKLGKGTLALGKRQLNADELKRELERVAPVPSPSSDWLLFQGNAARSGAAVGGRPVLDKPLWQRATILDKVDESGERDRGDEAETWIDSALKKHPPETPLLPGFFPIAAGDKVFYRTYNGTTAVASEEIRERGKVVGRFGEIEWKSTEFVSALAPLLADPNTRSTAEDWLRRVADPPGFPSFLFESAAVGTLCSDGRLVYALDTLAVPIPPTDLSPEMWKSPRIGDKIKPLVKQNSLHAFELESGKIAFSCGGFVRERDFGDSHFLGVPLPVSGRLYLLNEKEDGRIRLCIIEPRVERTAWGERWTYDAILPTGTLCKVHDRYVASPVRRTQPVHLACGDGVLVCPTHAGAVLGVDLITSDLLWMYTYRQGKPEQPPQPLMPLAPRTFDFRAEWHNPAPVIHGGKVVFTAADEPSVHCLDLLDGRLRWKAKRADDLYLACVQGGKVLLVGKSACRLDLKDGKQLWRLDTGVPSGMGVADGSTYYLPLRSAKETKRPGIAAIDLQKGRLAWVETARQETPGNLLFHRGCLISQGPTSITAYAVRKEGAK